MSEQKVQTFLICRKTTTAIDKDAFQFSKNAGWLWLQRLCFFALRKIGAYRQHTVEFIQRTPQQNNNLIKMLFEQQRVVRDMLERQRKFRVYVGPDEQYRLHELVQMNGGVVQLDTRLPVGNPGAWSGIRIFGISVTVIPWMSGCLVVPE